MTDEPLPEFALAERLTRDVLEPMKTAFVGKDEVIDLLGVCLVGGENLFILGPPGTAKSALVQDLSRRLSGQVFDYLLTRFTEPNEIFGPFDIRKLRDGELITNTEGMLPEASFVFLDELLNANSAILNSLLMVLNERVFRRGREFRKLPTLMVVGASNRLPEDETLGALFDRFLLRVHCGNVPQEQLHDVLGAGWKLDRDREQADVGLSVEEVRQLQSAIYHSDFSQVRAPYLELIHRLRHAGIPISDRRAVKLQRLLAASAILCGRLVVDVTDLWILRYIWDTEEQQEVIATLVQDTVETSSETDQTRHVRSYRDAVPDAEHLARDLERLSARLESGTPDSTETAYLRDQLGVLDGRCQWVRNDQQREHLQIQVQDLWTKLGGTA